MYIRPGKAHHQHRHHVALTDPGLCPRKIKGITLREWCGVEKRGPYYDNGKNVYTHTRHFPDSLVLTYSHTLASHRIAQTHGNIVQAKFGATM